MTSTLDSELAVAEEAIREGDWEMFEAGTLAEGWHGAGVGLRLCDLRSAAAGARVLSYIKK